MKKVGNKVWHHIKKEETKNVVAATFSLRQNLTHEEIMWKVSKSLDSKRNTDSKL